MVCTARLLFMVCGAGKGLCVCVGVCVCRLFVAYQPVARLQLDEMTPLDHRMLLWALGKFLDNVRETHNTYTLSHTYTLANCVVCITTVCHNSYCVLAEQPGHW